MKKAEETRKTILQKAFALSYAHGYQTTSIDTILAGIGVTKGAFYYHFKNKDEMGVAIVEEILRPTFAGSFTQTIGKKSDPVEALYAFFQNLLLNNELLRAEYGCPVANLAGEMTPWNTAFTEALNRLIQETTENITTMLENGKKDGFIRADVACREVVLFLISGYWGVRTLGKAESGKSTYLPYLTQLRHYLNSLR